MTYTTGHDRSQMLPLPEAVGLEQYSNRTLSLPNADQIFEQAEQTVQAAAAKYEAQLPLSVLRLNN